MIANRRFFFVVSAIGVANALSGCADSKAGAIFGGMAPRGGTRRQRAKDDEVIGRELRSREREEREGDGDGK